MLVFYMTSRIEKLHLSKTDKSMFVIGWGMLMYANAEVL